MNKWAIAYHAGPALWQVLEYRDRPYDRGLHASLEEAIRTVSLLAATPVVLPLLTEIEQL